MQSVLAIPHRVVAQRFHSIGGCISSCHIVIVGNITRAKVFALLNSLEELDVSLVSWVIGTINYVVDPWIGEILHGLCCRISAICLKSLRQMMMRGLISMHKLIVWCNGRLSNTILKSLRAMNCVAQLIRRKWTAGKLRHRVIISHADLSIVLIILPK